MNDDLQQNMLPNVGQPNPEMPAPQMPGVQGAPQSQTPVATNPAIPSMPPAQSTPQMPPIQPAMGIQPSLATAPAAPDFNPSAGSGQMFDPKHLRAKKARLGAAIGKTGFYLLTLGWILSLLGAATCFVAALFHPGAALVSLAIVCFMVSNWWRDELDEPLVTGNSLMDRLSGSALARFKPRMELTPLKTWDALSSHWQTRFITNRFLIPNGAIQQHLSDDALDMSAVWQNATIIADKSGSKLIEPGHITGALLLASPSMGQMFSEMKLSVHDAEDVVTWLSRGIALNRMEKPDFGGIGRDWANGFTPHLNQFGYNLSLAIERSGAHYDWRMDSRGVQAIKNAFSQGATAVALIGENGVGKTSHVHALAQALLMESKDRNLEHRQVISLNPSMIISSATHPGELEKIVNMLMLEAAHAGNIILFLDDAQLFFGGGPGSFDATQLLLPVVQSRRVQLILAMTPNEFQNLKTKNNGFASQLLPVMLTDPPQEEVMRVLEDATLGFEHKHKVLITYDALKEAYRLSGRYEQDIAYPGKAIALLEQSLSHANQGVVTASSVEQAIEQTRGIKVASAAPAESEALLNLEDTIHQRMINQTHAVSVVSSALRRARAGVSNPRRPIGSFLFLGPTGVGKTELAKAIAATYFNNEKSMIRLDMSEYQQPTDVTRLLSDGHDANKSLIMSVREQPFSVVLLDEIEKAHPNILNLLLQMLDEGSLTDTGGRPASFKDCVIIATSNAGAQSIRERVEHGEELQTFEKVLIDELITSNQFRPELLNRFDEIVLFRPLNGPELAQVVALMMNEINATLAPQNIHVVLTDAAVQKIVQVGYDARLGARPMRRTLQRAVEDTLARKILSQQVRPGSSVTFDAMDLPL